VGSVLDGLSDWISFVAKYIKNDLAGRVSAGCGGIREIYNCA
jgi:hypothetical protein